MIHSPLTHETLFWIGPLPISHAVAVTWALMALLGVGSWWLTRRLALHPSRLQAVLELLVTTLDAQIRDTMQVAAAAPYRGLIGSLFLFILAANWSELVPGIEPPTANLETD
ncbi:MAG: F0F1 ATP synthase subunit A, partial [Pseudomonadota bacterium]